MSMFKAEVVRLGIEPHPNADRLEVAKVRGWYCVVQKGLYKSGDLAVYVPLDAVLPDPLIAAAGIEKYYRKYLRTQKLRGIVSQGLVIPMSLVKDTGERPLDEGDDVTGILGLTKYDPPIPVHMAGQIRSPHAMFSKYTEIENYKNYPNSIPDGELVVATEKVHGSNFRAGKFDGELHVGSHNLSLKEDEFNLYWRSARLLNLKDHLQEGQVVFGEVYGAGVQDLAYGKKPGDISVALFDLFQDGRYLSHAKFTSFLLHSGLLDFAAPVVYVGEMGPDIVKMASGDSILCPGQIREGIVVRPMEERWDMNTGRVILKMVSDEYLCRRDATEFH